MSVLSLKVALAEFKSVRSRSGTKLIKYLQASDLSALDAGNVENGCEHASFLATVLP